MKSICILAVFALLLAGCGNTNSVEQENSSEVSVCSTAVRNLLSAVEQDDSKVSVCSTTVRDLPSAVEQDYLSEVCVWKDGQWTTDWMRMYVEYCRHKDRFFTTERIIDIWNTWGLAYVDNDVIPEMVLLCPGEAYGKKVLTIHNGEVVEWNSWRCYATYISRSGLIENHAGSMGEYWDKVFELKDGVFKEIFNHTDKFKPYEIDDTTEIRKYYCCFKGDSTLKIGDEMECEAYRTLKNDIYTSVGEVIDFGSIDHLPTFLFETGWPLNSWSKVCTLTLKVK